MPAKETLLFIRDFGFYLSGGADVAAADWRADPWVYPLDWEYQVARPEDYFAPFDQAGIPLRVFGGGLGTTYLPSRVAGWAFGHWNRWRARPADEAAFARFAACAAWFRETAPDGALRHAFPLASLSAGWLSCIAQGEAASVLVRMAIATGDRAWADAALLATDWLLRPEQDGGLQSRLPDGSPFLEEYPGTVYRHVLNGCLYAVVGLHDVWRYAPDRHAAVGETCSAIVDSVARHAMAWDVDGWSTYDFNAHGGPRNLNTMTYHRLQAILLHYLADVRDRPALRTVANRWEGSARRPERRLRALGGKVAYRFAHRW